MLQFIIIVSLASLVGGTICIYDDTKKQNQY